MTRASRIAQVLLVLLWGGALTTASACARSQEEVRRILEAGGFSGILDQEAEIVSLGNVQGAGERFEVYYYRREFGNQRLTQRLVLVFDSKYLGMYAIDEPPKYMLGRSVCFLADGGGDECVEMNPSGQTIYVGGELLELFK